MTEEEMAQAVENHCKQLNRIFGDDWLWEKFYEAFCRDCGIIVEKPEIDGSIDLKNTIRVRFAKAMRRVIPKKEYSLERVTEHKHELVRVILDFTH